MKGAKYKIGQIVNVRSEKDIEKICQGRIIRAETSIYENSTWFYTIEIPLPNNEKEIIYSYEESSGDAKTKIVA
jgi:hypothetical protein